ncbi:unnamed protein product [Closterium sp. Naga37s-1]|nr:unnamed protein product [Closterium sp. Naga37s-1]CAI5511055.1 unnamed protein product [Closterium sp. Naga37s-1]
MAGGGRELGHAEDTVVSYWMRYCPHAIRTLDWELLAKAHNGLPCPAPPSSPASFPLPLFPSFTPSARSTGSSSLRRTASVVTWCAVEQQRRRAQGAGEGGEGEWAMGVDEWGRVMMVAEGGGLEKGKGHEGQVDGKGQRARGQLHQVQHTSRHHSSRPGRRRPRRLLLPVRLLSPSSSLHRTAPFAHIPFASATSAAIAAATLAYRPSSPPSSPNYLSTSPALFFPSPRPSASAHSAPPFSASPPHRPSSPPVSSPSPFPRSLSPSASPTPAPAAAATAGAACAARGAPSPLLLADSPSSPRPPSPPHATCQGDAGVGVGGEAARTEGGGRAEAGLEGDAVDLELLRALMGGDAGDAGDGGDGADEGHEGVWDKLGERGWGVDMLLHLEQERGEWEHGEVEEGRVRVVVAEGSAEEGNEEEQEEGSEGEGDLWQQLAALMGGAGEKRGLAVELDELDAVQSGVEGQHAAEAEGQEGQEEVGGGLSYREMAQWLLQHSTEVIWQGQGEGECEEEGEVEGGDEVGARQEVGEEEAPGEASAEAEAVEGSQGKASGWGGAVLLEQPVPDAELAGAAELKGVAEVAGAAELADVAELAGVAEAESGSSRSGSGGRMSSVVWEVVGAWDRLLWDDELSNVAVAPCAAAAAPCAAAAATCAAPSDAAEAAASSAVVPLGGGSNYAVAREMEEGEMGGKARAAAVLQLCSLWSHLHTDLRERSRTFHRLSLSLSLSPSGSAGPAAATANHSLTSSTALHRTHSCMDAWSPEAVLVEVERLQRQCKAAERRGRGGRVDGCGEAMGVTLDGEVQLEEAARKEHEQRAAVMRAVRAAMGRGERLRLYDQWGVDRWQQSRLHTIVFQRLWNEPMRCAESAALVAKFLP